MKPPVEAPTSSARRPATSTPERVERVGELDPAARDERRRRGDVELDVVGDELPGLLRPPPPGAEVHVAGEHRGRGARARREQPALGEQGVEPHAGHGRANGTDRRLSTGTWGSGRRYAAATLPRGSSTAAWIRSAIRSAV